MLDLPEEDSDEVDSDEVDSDEVDSDEVDSDEEDSDEVDSDEGVVSPPPAQLDDEDKEDISLHQLKKRRVDLLSTEGTNAPQQSSSPPPPPTNPSSD